MLSLIFWLFSCDTPEKVEQPLPASVSTQQGNGPSSRQRRGPDVPFQGARPRHIPVSTVDPLASLNDQSLSPSTPEIYLQDPPPSAAAATGGLCSDYISDMFSRRSFRRQFLFTVSDDQLER